MKNKFKNLIIDVDGVMTDGKFYYTEKGKIMKKFGPDDNDALKIIEDYINVQFITGDKKGYKISKKRISNHMGFKLNLVSTVNRLEWIKKNFEIKKTIYIGDGIFDGIVMKNVGFSIAPSDASEVTKKFASLVLKRKGGDRAVAEAVIYILNKFLTLKTFILQLKKIKNFLKLVIVIKRD